MKLYQRDPYTNRKVIVAKDGIAVKNYWVQAVINLRQVRIHVEKGTEVDQEGIPTTLRFKPYKNPEDR